jgi:hypothetical protein
VTTTTTLAPEAVELEAHYEVTYSNNAYRIVDGYHLADLLTAHRLPGGLEIKQIGGEW